MTELKGCTGPMDCEAVVRAIWDYLDDNVTASQLSAIEEHLARCDHCVAHTEFERALVGRIGRIRREHSDPERLRSHVIAALRNAAAAPEG